MRRGKTGPKSGFQFRGQNSRHPRARIVLAHLFFEKHRFRARFCRIRFKLPQCVSDQPLHFVDRTRYAVNLHPLCFAPAMAGFSVVEQYSDGKSMIVVPLLRKGQMLCVVQVDLLEEDLRMTHKEPTNLKEWSQGQNGSWCHRDLGKAPRSCDASCVQNPEAGRVASFSCHGSLWCGHNRLGGVRESVCPQGSSNFICRQYHLICISSYITCSLADLLSVRTSGATALSQKLAVRCRGMPSALKFRRALDTMAALHIAQPKKLRALLGCNC